jgi:hypothetical protein
MTRIPETFFQADRFFFVLHDTQILGIYSSEVLLLDYLFGSTQDVLLSLTNPLLTVS